MPDDAYGIDPDYQIPDAMWVQMMRALPPRPPERKDDRHAMTAISCVLRTGRQWKVLPRSLGAAP